MNIQQVRLRQGESNIIQGARFRGTQFPRQVTLVRVTAPGSMDSPENDRVAFARALPNKSPFDKTQNLQWEADQIENRRPEEAVTFPLNLIRDRVVRNQFVSAEVVPTDLINPEVLVSQGRNPTEEREGATLILEAAASMRTSGVQNPLSSAPGKVNLEETRNLRWTRTISGVGGVAYLGFSPIDQNCRVDWSDLSVVLHPIAGKGIINSQGSATIPLSFPGIYRIHYFAKPSSSPTANDYLLLQRNLASYLSSVEWHHGDEACWSHPDFFLTISIRASNSASHLDLTILPSPWTILPAQEPDQPSPWSGDTLLITSVSSPDPCIGPLNKAGHAHIPLPPSNSNIPDLFYWPTLSLHGILL